MEEKDIRVRSAAELLGQLPPPVRDHTRRADSTTTEFGALPTLVVLDDDPTGTQTCHDISVLTIWDVPVLVEQFRSPEPGFFILTNSRALPTDEARTLIRGICRAVKEAAHAEGKEFEIVLRGDSTLRGHFPDEPEVASEVVGRVDAWILAPFFFEGGRLTIDDVHYVADGDSLVPAAQTPFAKDATFGYKNSNLRNYVVEKSKGGISREQIRSVTLHDIRIGGAEAVSKLLLSLQDTRVIIVNAAAVSDMETFIQGLLAAQKQGKRYLYRTGAAFVSSRLGIKQIPPISLSQLHLSDSEKTAGGLIVAGSYVPKTTAQLEQLVAGRGSKLTVVTLDVEELLASEVRAESAAVNAQAQAAESITGGKDVLVMTTRKLIVGKDETSSLAIGSIVAKTLVRFLQGLQPRPRYVIAKGGITSSDAATKGLNMKRARIIGQAASGVPLWQCNESTSKFCGVPYVVFPGNVGDNDTLLNLVERWST